MNFRLDKSQTTIKSNPTLITLHRTSDDASVPVQNSISYFLALRKMGMPTVIYKFEHGAHSVGLIVDNFDLGQWESLHENWYIRWMWAVKN